MKDKLERNNLQEGMDIQENQTVAASQLGSTDKMPSKPELIEFNDCAGSEHGSVLMGRTSHQSASKNGANVVRPKTNAPATKAGLGTPSGSFFHRNSSVGISETVAHEDHESHNERTNQSQGSAFIQNLRVNSKTRPKTAKRGPAHTLINQRPELIPVQSTGVVS